MAWDVDYGHAVEKIGGDTDKKTEDKWQMYRAFLDVQQKAKQIQRSPLQLSDKEKEQVQKLREIDRKVRAHEMAHLIAGGPYVRGGPYYKYVTGPDGRRYAVAGEVKIDTSEEKDPEKTIQKMETVKRAALAPADPSPTDRRVAAEAAAKEARARAKLMEEKMKEMRKNMEHTNYDKASNIYRQTKNIMENVIGKDNINASNTADINITL